MNKRDYTKSRRALAKAFAAELKIRGRAAGWRINQGVAFMQRHDWFFAIVPSVWITEDKAEAKILAKPMVVDPILWAMMGHPELGREPLSYRYFGILAATPIILADRFLSGETADALADCALRTGEDCARIVAESTLDVSDYHDRLHSDGFGINDLGARVAALIGIGKEEQARALLLGETREAPNVEVIGSKGGFASRATEWFEERRRSMN